MNCKITTLVAFAVLPWVASYAATYRLGSPSSRLEVVIPSSSSPSSAAIRYDGSDILGITRFGVTREGKDSAAWEIQSLMSESPVKSDYVMLTGKRRHCSAQGMEYRLDCSGDGSRRLVMRVYDDGVAFRYEIDNLGGAAVDGELTSYKIDDGTERWLQNFKTDYEDFYLPSDKWDESPSHYAYPLLLQAPGGKWALISEANVLRGNSASSLKTDGKRKNEYMVSPAGKMRDTSGTWTSPWRVVVAGDLSDIVESTLITDVSDQPASDNTGWIKSGVVSWIYWAHNHGSKDYQIVRKYVDMAVELGLPYVLIDWEWDVMGNGGTVEDAVRYARSKNVKPLLWYNSCTAWAGENAPGPLYRLNTSESREKEFAWLESLGVAGIKIDFFSGDTAETMDYCIDLLESAARHRLLVNFHGATIPRGWQRTYPNFMSAEAVYGAEWYNNKDVLTARAASHNATLPFTRNVIGPMDYTPCTFSDSQHPHITTDAHELALTVVFESALQHLADRPESYLAQPREVKAFLGGLPSVWDDTRLLSGYPGNHVALARRCGDRWYVGILNGTDGELTVNPDWTKIGDSGECRVRMFADGKSDWNITEPGALPASVVLRPRGGAVFVVDNIENIEK